MLRTTIGDSILVTNIDTRLGIDNGEWIECGTIHCSLRLLAP